MQSCENEKLDGIVADSAALNLTSSGKPVGMENDTNQGISNLPSDMGKGPESPAHTGMENKQTVVARLIRRLDKLFSDESLFSNWFLLRRVRWRGDEYISMKLLAELMTNICNDDQTLQDALRQSSSFEVSLDGQQVRRRKALPCYLKTLPMEEGSNQYGENERMVHKGRDNDFPMGNRPKCPHNFPRNDFRKSVPPPKQANEEDKGMSTWLQARRQKIPRPNDKPNLESGSVRFFAVRQPIGPPNDGSKGFLKQREPVFS